MTYFHVLVVLAHHTLKGLAAIEDFALILKKVVRISGGNYGALGKRRSRSSFKAEIAGSNPARPAVCGSVA
jgi:hypothetical protein